MKKPIIALACTFALAGCAGTFGHTSYEVKAKAMGGCDLKARDGKEFSGTGREVSFDGKKCQFGATEGPSKAFKGQGIGSTLNPLPTMGLDKILAPRGE